jgi:hypothetical protein
MTTLLSCKIWTQTGTNSIDSKSDFVFSFIPTVRGDRCEAVLAAQKAKPAIRCYEVARDSGALKFWDDPEEDIYTMESGKPV